MSKTSPIRSRTFVVPLAGVALYYCVQFIAAIPILAFFPQDDIYQRLGLFMVLVAVIMGLSLGTWLYISRKSVLPTIRRDPLTIKRSLTIVPIALSMLAFAGFYMIAVSLLAQAIPQIDMLMKNYSEMVSVDSSVPYDTVLYYIAVGILIPVVEEIVFRGIILGEFLSTMRAPTAVILSSVVFGSMHVQPIQVGYAIMCGLILGFVYLYSNSIYVSILVHSVFNIGGGVLTDIFSKNNTFFETFSVILEISIMFGIISFLYLKKGYTKSLIREG